MLSYFIYLFGLWCLQEHNSSKDPAGEEKSESQTWREQKQVSIALQFCFIWFMVWLLHNLIFPFLFFFCFFFCCYLSRGVSTASFLSSSGITPPSSSTTLSQPIIISDTPSPAVSIITIHSDTDTEDERKFHPARWGHNTPLCSQNVFFFFLSIKRGKKQYIILLYFLLEGQWEMIHLFI